MLSDAQLERMRNVANDSLPGTAIIRAGTLASDGGGGYSETFSNSGTVACRVAPILRGDEGQVGGRISSDADWIVTLPAQTSVETDDQLLIDGDTHTVVAVKSPRSFETTCRVETRRLT